MSPPNWSRNIRDIPYMGVIYVVAEAMKLGFTNGHPDWCNLGQGQPEVGPMEGAPPRLPGVELDPGDHAYGPVGGTPELRECIAAHYNRLYRRGKTPYSADNVSVASGGRLMLSRLFAAFGPVNVGYQTPDYTAYEDYFAYHQHRIAPALVATREEDGFGLTPERFASAVEEQGLGAYVLSNPCNPTGCVLRGAELASVVDTARRHDCLLAVDEFYSHFIYDGERPAAGPVSAAEYIENVERDPVVLVDGLTKCFRYPGWRLGWAVGPTAVVDNLGRAASAIDGGPSTLVQRAALQVLEPARADQETTALRAVFSRKRNLTVRRLREMGIRCARDSESTFYAWASIADLPEPLDDAETFFRRALERKVMTVPGIFFDVDPGRRRPRSPFRQWVRFSFGPPEDNLAMGLDRIEAMIREAREA